jgi:hypothetical protein
MEFFRDLDLELDLALAAALPLGLHSRLPWPRNSHYSPIYPPNSAA